MKIILNIIGIIIWLGLMIAFPWIFWLFLGILALGLMGL